MGERRRARPVGQRTLPAEPETVPPGSTDEPGPAESPAAVEVRRPPRPPEDLPDGSNAALFERQRRWLRTREGFDAPDASGDGRPGGG